MQVKPILLVVVVVLVLLAVGFAVLRGRQSQMDSDEEWHYYPCTVGDDQAFIFVNIGIAESIHAAPGSLAKLRLTLQTPNAQGLPSQEEFDRLVAIEGRIENFASEVKDWYVGRISLRGHRTFYVYTSRDEADWSAFLKSLKSQTGYEIALTLKNDPDHATYQNDLYPTPDDWQIIKDLLLLENLEKHGDDGSTARKIDHWIVFPDKESSVDFVAWATADRFTKDPGGSHITDEGDYYLQLSHHGTLKLEDISSHTIALRQKAEEFGGEYDGWETEIVEPDRR